MMKEEEKLLLLEDISARLPFGLAFITKQGMIEMDVINLADIYKVWAYKKRDKHGNEIGLDARRSWCKLGKHGIPEASHYL